MKLSFSSDLSSPPHWDRVVDFGRAHQASRLVYWGYGLDLCLYPKYPKMLPEGGRAKNEKAREHFREAAERTAQAGMEFWYTFWIWKLPEMNHVRRAYPELFTRQGEIDMASERSYQLIRDQLDEIRMLSPHLHGIELWVMEVSSMPVANMVDQDISIEDICARIVETVYQCLEPVDLKLDVDLHTSGNDPASKRGLFRAAVRHPDIIISGDNVAGDFCLTLPFNVNLRNAARTNPVSVHFDLNGEYWGRNFVPTSALSQYAAHIEEARKIGAAYVDGRLATEHNRRNPHANVLPSRRKLYPALAETADDEPLPPDLDISCTDTLGGFNAEYFCRRVKDPLARPEETVRDFLRREFGENATTLVSTFMKLEGLLKGIFFADTNYYGFQSVLPNPRDMGFWYLSTQMICEAGTEFPTPEILKEIASKPAFSVFFAGAPVPDGFRCGGPEAMIREKQAALEDADSALREVRDKTADLRPADREYLVKQFEDLLLFARAFRYLLEAQVHYYLTKAGKKSGDLPNPMRLQELMSEIQKAADEWQTRYPGGRYDLAARLQLWVGIMRQQ